jgi:hypothetical protein
MQGRRAPLRAYKHSGGVNIAPVFRPACDFQSKAAQNLFRRVNAAHSARLLAQEAYTAAKPAYSQNTGR